MRCGWCWLERIRLVIKTNISSVSWSPPAKSVQILCFISHQPLLLSLSPPLLIFTESRLPPSLPSPPSLTHLYFLSWHTLTHTHWHSPISNTLPPAKTSLSVIISLFLTNTHVHVHYAHWCVCFCPMVFQWGVSLGGCWSDWCFYLKTSSWVNAGDRRRSPEAGKPNRWWVSDRAASFYCDWNIQTCELVLSCKSQRM